MLFNCVSTICNAPVEILPLKFPARIPYLDTVTSVFCGILLLITLLIAFNRRKFSNVMRALFSPRVRTQLQRESKVFGEWFYFFCIVYYFLVQGMLIFLLVQYLLPGIAEGWKAFPLYFIAIDIVMADYFIKLLNTFFLAYVFECPEDRANFNLTKFLYQMVNSVVLLPLLVASVYTEIPQILFLYVPVFLTTYGTLIYRTLTLNSNRIRPFLFFLYFCTLEILPYLIILKIPVPLR